jgi:hypothetical protein
MAARSPKTKTPIEAVNIDVPLSQADAHPLYLS